MPRIMIPRKQTRGFPRVKSDEIRQQVARGGEWDQALYKKDKSSRSSLPTSGHKGDKIDRVITQHEKLKLERQSQLEKKENEAKLKMERESARLTLEKMKRTVETDDCLYNLEVIEKLCGWPSNQWIPVSLGRINGQRLYAAMNKCQ